MSDFIAVKQLLDELGQSHVYQVTDCLQGSDDHPILQQLNKLDLKDSISHFQAAHEVQAKLDAFQPVTPSIVNLNDDPATWSEELLQSYEVGKQALHDGKVAAVILSGGQGTRLGFNGPKGMYDIGMPSHKSIFQYHIEKILKVRQLVSENSKPSAIVPVYVMTSNLNHSIIVEFFERNNFFGCAREDIFFFEQGLEPCFTFDGKIIVESPSNLSLAPDGNGGVYKALKFSGAADDMKRRGIEHLHVYGIDNVLTKSLDPLFLGLCIKNQAECGNKVVWRAHRNEKVGVTAQLDGRMHILEYSEIPPSLSETEIDGKLLFGAANICNHYLNLSFLIDKVFPNLSSIYHFANKKIPCWDPVSKSVQTPTTVNGVKLEMFIFDIFPLASKWVVLESHRDDEFAPVKNEPGNVSDSPDTARRYMSQQAKKWLLRNGAKIVGDESALCEISPLLSYAGEGLESFKGVEVRLPCYLGRN